MKQTWCVLNATRYKGSWRDITNNQDITKDQDETTLQTTHYKGSRQHIINNQDENITKDQDEITCYSQDTLQRIKTRHCVNQTLQHMTCTYCEGWKIAAVYSLQERAHCTHLVDVQHFFQENFADHWRCRLFELVEVSPCNSKRCFFKLWSHPIHVSAPLLCPAGVCGQNWMSASPSHWSHPYPTHVSTPSTSYGHLSSGTTPSMSPPHPHHMAT